MNRIEAAIREGRCVLAIGKQALSNPEVLAELRHRSIPAVTLGGNATNPVSSLSAENLSAALGKAGGVLVLVEPDGASDGRALNELGEIIKAAGTKPKLFVAARNPISATLDPPQATGHNTGGFVETLPMV